ncbi:YckD family protein [Piscibacillus sp. B03]|uniref:YckD family protein n=1 Tax=Piscibacillus sp. B03 TaxID=3457430 RepID=UPI003FCE1E1E
MKKLWLSLITVTVLAIGLFGVASAEPESTENVELTDDQKEEMASLQKEVLEKEKQVIQKYVEYGVISKDKGDKVISHLEKHFEKLEANGYVPMWDKKHKKTHGDDEDQGNEGSEE